MYIYIFGIKLNFTLYFLQLFKKNFIEFILMLFSKKKKKSQKSSKYKLGIKI